LELVEDVEELTVEELVAGPGGVSLGAGGSSGGGGPGLEMAIGQESLLRIALPESARSFGVATASLQSKPQIETKSHPTKVDFVLRSNTVEVETLEDVRIVYEELIDPEPNAIMPSIGVSAGVSQRLIDHCGD
jgi:hypothetical protein